MAVAFIYGFSEGPWHSRKLRKALRQTGYNITTDISKSDILIAHSGGCLLVPEDYAGLLVMINPTYWPSNKPWHQALNKVKVDVKTYLLCHPIHLMSKFAANMYYFLTSWDHNRMLKRGAQKYQMPNSIPIPKAAKVIIVRNANDTWCTPALAALEAKMPNLRIINLPGDHDNCWFNPQPYTNLLQSEYDKW